MHVRLDRPPSALRRFRVSWRYLFVVATVLARVAMFASSRDVHPQTVAAAAPAASATRISHIRIPQPAPDDVARKAAALSRALRVPIVADPSVHGLEVRLRP